MSGVSLKKFAASQVRPGPVCAVCQSPNRKELEAAYAEGLRFAVMVRWLSEVHGETQTRGTLYNHFHKGHAK
jgi:hypothetical protein